MHGHSTPQTNRALRQGGPKPLQELFTARSLQHAARQFILYSPLSDNPNYRVLPGWETKNII